MGHGLILVGDDRSISSLTKDCTKHTQGKGGNLLIYTLQINSNLGFGSNMTFESHVESWGMSSRIICHSLKYCPDSKKHYLCKSKLLKWRVAIQGRRGKAYEEVLRVAIGMSPPYCAFQKLIRATNLTTE